MKLLITREGCSEIRTQMEKALSVLDKMGLSVHIGNMSYSPNTDVRMKVTLTQKDTKQKADKKDKRADKMYVWHGMQYRFVEYNSRRPKFPYSMERVADGRRFKWTEQLAKATGVI